MKITILGYWDEHKKEEWKLIGEQADFISACEHLGSELAKRKQTIIVANDALDAADYHVVKGYLNVYGKETCKNYIQIVQLTDENFTFQEFWNYNPHLFTTRRQLQCRKEEAKLVSVKESDAVITIGGIDTTYHVGMAAILAKKNLIPIASFGGASGQLLDYLLKHENLKNKKAFGQLYGRPCSAYIIQTAVQLTGIDRSVNLFLIHGHSNDYELLKDWFSDKTMPETISIMKDRFQVGQTLTEKFEKLALQADAAIALLTPDDFGGINQDASSRFKPRARQNIWLEVGWFWGHLGRSKVMLLNKGDVEIPSDLTGLELLTYIDAPQEREADIRKFIARIKTNQADASEEDEWL